MEKKNNQEYSISIGIIGRGKLEKKALSEAISLCLANNNEESFEFDKIDRNLYLNLEKAVVCVEDPFKKERTNLSKSYRKKIGKDRKK